MLSFADGGLASPVVLTRLEVAAGRFLDGDEGWDDDLVALLCDTPSAELLFTFRPLCAFLFSRFGADDPDATAGTIADMVRAVVTGVWGMGPADRRRHAVGLVGVLIASDFDPDDTTTWEAIDVLRPGELLAALAQWTIAMSITLSYVGASGCDGGAPIGWFTRRHEAPDVGDRVIVGGAAS